MILIENPFPLFSDNNGELLENGYIYIGTAGLNPEASPINVFWDKDLLYPAAQPVRTISGLPARGGTPAPLYTASTEYSVMTKDKNQVFIYSTSYYPTEVVPANGSVTGPSIDDTAAFIFPTLLSLQKGADITPTAGVLTLGIDGNYFDVTGTNPINSIASIGVGTQAVLQFDTALVFTYDVANLILQGDASITTEAGDHAFIVEYEAGRWRCESFVRASSLPALLTDANTFSAANTFSGTTSLQDVDELVLQGSAWPSFRVYVPSSQLVASSTITKVEFASETFDTNNDFDSTTNYRFTPTVAGKYLLTARVAYQTGLGVGINMIVYIYKNGALVSLSSTYTTVNNVLDSNISVSDIFDANGSTDYFEIFTFHDKGSSNFLLPTSSYTYFSGSRVA